MRIRFYRLPVVLAAVAVSLPLAVCAWAQEGGGDHGSPDWAPPTDLPRVEHNDPTYNLDTLFEALKIAPDDDSAKAIEQRIWAVWAASGSDTCALLMTRVKAATEAKEYDLAINLLNAVIDIKPDFVDAWNRRATLYYLKSDYAHSIADIGEVLRREPRHFAALSGLGQMLQDLGDDKDALDAYRKALAVDPHLEHVPDAVKTLTEKVEGRDI